LFYDSWVKMSSDANPAIAAMFITMYTMENAMLLVSGLVYLLTAILPAGTPTEPPRGRNMSMANSIRT